MENKIFITWNIINFSWAQPTTLLRAPATLSVKTQEKMYNVPTYPIFNLIFLAFFIGMSLIVNNLLIAVAVSGTEELQSKSKLMQTKRRISYIEEQLANNLLFLRLKNLGFKISFSCLDPIFKSQDCILTECYSKGNYRVNICIL